MTGLLSVRRWLWRKVQAVKEFVSGDDMKAVYGEHPNGDPEGPDLAGSSEAEALEPFTRGLGGRPARLIRLARQKGAAMRLRTTPCPTGPRPRGSRHLLFRAALRAAAVTVALVALGACSEGDPDDEADPGSSTSSPATDSSASESGTDDARLTGAPAVGTCWRMSPARAVDENYWFDDSAQVPCAQRHTLETVAVYPLDKANPKAALEQDALCDQDAHLYIGTSSKNWVPWHYYAFLPSRAQVADGASWSRCDVAFAAQTSGGRPAWSTGSAEEVALRHPEEVWGCLDAFPKPTHPHPYTPCDKPHAYEATGHLLLLEDLDGYPTPRELRSAAADCNVALRNPDYEGLALRALWRPPDEMWGPDRLIGTCWVHRPDGQDLPPLR